MNYPERYEHLIGLIGQLNKEAPATVGAFMQLHNATTKAGVLSAKTKELIALAIGINVRCDGCVAYHVHDAVAAGATHDEVIETIGVAIMMGGGPSVVYGVEALDALSQFEQAPNQVMPAAA
jgi:AhpD family alkylhydroperoxidase